MKHCTLVIPSREPQQIVVVVVVMTSPSGTAYMGDKEVPKRWGIPQDSESGGIRLSLVVVDSHLLTGAPLKGGCRCPQLTYCQPLSNNRCWRCRQTVKLQSVLWLCSGFCRSKDLTNSIKVLKEQIYAHISYWHKVESLRYIFLLTDLICHQWSLQGGLWLTSTMLSISLKLCCHTL